MWLLVQFANEKLKQDTETQDVDGMQAMTVLYMTQLEGSGGGYGHTK